jgi:hypothetical protein
LTSRVAVLFDRHRRPEREARSVDLRGTVVVGRVIERHGGHYPSTSRSRGARSSGAVENEARHRLLADRENPADLLLVHLHAVGEHRRMRFLTSLLPNLGAASSSMLPRPSTLAVPLRRDDASR